MPAANNPHHLHQYLVDLQVESLRVIASFTGILAYFILLALLWPALHPSAPLVAWAAGIALAVGSLAGIYLPDRHYRLAAHLVVWSVLGAAVCAAVLFRSSEALYLFIVPVIFASVLFNRRTALLAATLVLVCILVTGVEIGVARWFSGEIWLPTLIVALVAVSAWLSAQRLYVALSWFGDAYERAHINEREARDRQAELQRTLKALDEANYRVERANYMLAIARDQAEEARQLKQHFVQNVSHELRTPLNMIIGFTELMAKSPDYYGAP
ncbi:MAG TPA: histidine kinase dimerization/phospho-acceptor domain-containing protein, partial [Caldilineaceae bacterium]|nr:histidine kinase dimerization/phospho-acceptor domain-containing protein [Caldilineaceae bacterium]